MRLSSGTRAFVRGLGHEVHALIVLFLIPVPVVVLPWRIGRRYLWWLTRFPTDWSGREGAAEALARRHGVMGERRAWIRRYRFHRLLDTADFYLLLTRGGQWMGRNLRIVGDFPERSRPVLALTFHFGAGMWALPLFRSRGLPLAWLHAGPADHAPWGEKVSQFFSRLRLRLVRRVSGAEPIPVGGAFARMRGLLERGEGNVMALVDPPPRPGQSFYAVRLLGRPARLPAGIPRLGAMSDAEVVFYSSEIDWSNGQRVFRLEPLPSDQGPEALAIGLAGLIDDAIARDSSGWHFWPFADRFFTAADTPEAGPRSDETRLGSRT